MRSLALVKLMKCRRAAGIEPIVAFRELHHRRRLLRSLGKRASGCRRTSRPSGISTTRSGCRTSKPPRRRPRPARTLRIHAGDAPPVVARGEFLVRDIPGDDRREAVFVHHARELPIRGDLDVKAAHRLQRRRSRRLPLEVRDGQRQLRSLGRLNERGRDLNVVRNDGGVQPGQRRQQPRDENGQERVLHGCDEPF